MLEWWGGSGKETKKTFQGKEREQKREPNEDVSDLEDRDKDVSKSFNMNFFLLWWKNPSLD